jgi:alpha-ketoglutaric semialdehyde dehydrogenase
MPGTVTSTSPADPADVIGDFPVADAAAVGSAIASARTAGRSWGEGPAHARSAALQAAAAAVEAAGAGLVELMVREVGKPVTEARGELARAVAILRYYAQQALDPDGETYPAADGRSLLMSRRHPHGVAGLITPWNFPVAIPLWKAAPALAFGNTVVWKPSPDAAATAAALADVLAPNLPSGVLQLVQGGGETGAALVDGAACVSFTGSVAIGTEVAMAATRRGVPVQAEMGGLNASVVLPDADVERAASTIANAAMGYAGQKCTATSRVIVIGDAASFTEALVTAIEELPVGDPTAADTVVGPLIRADAAEAVLDATQRARSQGGTLATGGTRAGDKGHYLAPTLVTGLEPRADLAQREVFGPIAVVLPAGDADEAVHIANDVEYGLVTALFTRDLDRALELVDRFETGLVKVNAATSGVDFHAPFGGDKRSSVGPREQGKAARAFYTATRTIAISPSGA